MGACAVSIVGRLGLNASRSVAQDVGLSFGTNQRGSTVSTEKVCIVKGCNVAFMVPAQDISGIIVAIHDILEHGGVPEIEVLPAAEC